MYKYGLFILFMTFSLPGCSGSTNSSNTNASTNIPGVGEKVGLGLCNNFYSTSFKPVLGKAVAAKSAALLNSEPAKAVRFADPAFKTCVVRASDWDAEKAVGRAVPFYSRSQAFNADSSQYILQAADGFWHLYNTEDLSYVRRVSLGGSDIEVNWHETDPDIIYKMDQNGGIKIYAHDISDASDNSVTVVADFTDVTSIVNRPGVTNIQNVWPNATRFYTASEGSASGDNRYWALFGVSEDFNTSYGMIVYDMVTDSIIGLYDFATDGGGVTAPNNISMSPSGTHVVALWNPPSCTGRPNGKGTLNNPCGTMAFNKDFTKATALAFNGEHGDTAVGVDGKDVYVGIEYQTDGAIEIIDLDTGNITAKPYTQVWAPGAFHISGRAVNKPGWVVISSYGQTANNGFDNRVVAVSLGAEPVIYNLAHHYSTSRDYFSQPHATVNRQGTKILFGSDWGGNALNADTYIIHIPANLTDL